MGHFTAFLPACAGLRHPSLHSLGAPAAQADISVSLIPSDRTGENA